VNTERLKWLADRLGMTPEQRRRAWRWLRPAWPGTLRRTTPLSDRYGFDRGTPIDRYYIEAFLSEHRRDIRGCALEIKDCTYVTRFGSGVEHCDVLDIDARNPHATIVTDLASADVAPSDRFDCFVLMQTLQFLRDLPAAIGHAHRMLKPGGVLLVTVPAVARIERTLAHVDYWRFTAASCTALFGEQFGKDNIEVVAYGNVLTATAFLMGMAAEELRRDELDTHDPYFPVLICVRGVKR
jgi:SAM-dependent methyltransferase